MDPYNSADAHPPARPPVAPVNPYAAPHAHTADVRIDENFVKSSRGARLGAVLLDSLVIAVPAMLLAIVLPVFGRGSSGPGAGATVGLALFGFGAIAYVVLQ